MKIKSYSNILVLFIIFIISCSLITTVESFGGRQKQHESKVLLKDVGVLTLKNGLMTKARRSSPIKQIECIGGTARKEKELYPDTIQCYNMGSNGNDVQWKCDANLDTSVKLGNIEVSCEGYNFPEDPYITQDSCGVFYELEYSNAARRKQAEDEDGPSWFTFLLVIALIIFVFYAIFNWCGTPLPDGSNGNNNYNAPADNPYPYGNGGGYPGGVNPTAPPPQGPGGYQGYPNLNPGAGIPPGCNNNNNGGGWFQPGWTGVALAYLLGRNSGRSNRSYYSSTPSYNSYGSRRSYSGGGSGISSVSSSFSGTSRR